MADEITDEVLKHSKSEVDFVFKAIDDGSLLTLHHTKKENKEVKRIRFKRLTFSWDSKHLCLVDHRGNVFLFEFATRKCWKHMKVLHCSVVESVNGEIDYAIGTKQGNIILLNIGLSDFVRKKQISNYCIQGISYFESQRKEKMLLIYSDQDATLCCLNTLEYRYRLEYNERTVMLKYVSIIPNTGKIFACFSNDSLHIWSSLTLNTIQIIHPIQMKSRYLKQGHVDCLTLSGALHFDNDSVVKDIKSYIAGTIVSCSFSFDGKVICLITDDDFILLISTAKFNIFKLIQIIDNTCKAIIFTPQLCDCFYILTGSSDVILFDYTCLNIKTVINKGKTCQLSASNNGKLLALLLNSGEVKLYPSTIAVQALRNTEKIIEEIKLGKERKCSKRIGESSLTQLLQKSELEHILQEYGEYPMEHRQLIWFSLLQLPKNRQAFMDLFKKDENPAVYELLSIYNLKDKSIQRNVAKILSCLLHWSGTLQHCNYLPNFVFPFLKIFPNSPMLTFELLVAVIMNYCQLWFEFIPIEPLNYLAIVENILMEYDSKLVKYYQKMKVTAATYAWPLMTTAFSEVLEGRQWYQLWDNIISNNPEYLIFCIAAFNITMKSMIMSLKAKKSIEMFFHEQNCVNMHKMIITAKNLMHSCPANIHPKKYITEYKKLPKNFYPKIELYPKYWLDFKNKHTETVVKQDSLIENKLKDILAEEEILLKELKAGLKNEVYEKQMSEMAKSYGDALQREEQRIFCRHKMLLMHQKQIESRKMKIMENLEDTRHRRNIESRANELDMLRRNIERNRLKEDTCMHFAEGKVNSCELDLLIHEELLEKDDKSIEDLKSLFENNIKNLCDERREMKSRFKSILTKKQDLTSNTNNLKAKLSCLQNNFSKIVNAS